MLKRIGLTLLIVLLAFGAAAWWMQHRVSTPYRGFNGQEVFVEIAQGSSVGAIGAKLADAGVVPDALTFQVAARVSGAERRLQAGEYRFADPASPLAIVARLRRGEVYTQPVTFPEGLTIREMAVIFERSSLGTAAAFEAASHETGLLADLDPEADSLEGYLFPDTYAWPRHAAAAADVRTMLTRFLQAYDADLRAAAAARGLGIREVVTLASIIEKETASPAERPIISAVYQNRLRIGMPLQCDPTIIYALMRAGRWNGNITRADLQIESPYNTYRHPGLPPGPIASPGRASLDAAVHPADVPYLYFVSRNDGTHAFARTLAEHNRNVARFQVEYFRNQHAAR